MSRSGLEAGACDACQAYQSNHLASVIESTAAISAR
jgi:hypothetical protein